MLPRTIVWEDGLKYDIDRVIDIRPAYAAKAGGQGDRYTIQVMKEFSEPAVDAKASYSFVASFAWSAYSCLIGGYPQNSPSECLTLSEACAEDGVSVIIQTSEPGICFEEHITCDDTGTVEHTEKDLLAYKCRHCGEITSFASFEDPDDQECPECGNCGFDRCEEV